MHWQEELRATLGAVSARARPLMAEHCHAAAFGARRVRAFLTVVGPVAVEQELQVYCSLQVGIDWSRGRGTRGEAAHGNLPNVLPSRAQGVGKALSPLFAGRRIEKRKKSTVSLIHRGVWPWLCHRRREGDVFAGLSAQGRYTGPCFLSSGGALPRGTPREDFQDSTGPGPSQELQLSDVGNEDRLPARRGG